MRGGHNAKPTEQKLAEGNKGHRPLNPELEPPRLAGGIDRKRFSPAAQPHYDDLKSILEPRGQWSRDSYLIVKQGCDLLAMKDELTRELELSGLIVDGRASDVLKTLLVINNQIKSILESFGLTDATRARVKIEAAKKEANNPLAAYGLN